MAAPEEPPPGVPSAKPHRLREFILQPRWFFTILAIATVVGVTVLAIVPVQERVPFAYGGAVYGSSAAAFSDLFSQPLCPAGATAAMAFSSSGLDVTFGITAPNGTSIWSEHSADVNISIVVPTCGSYQLTAAGSGDGNWAVHGAVSWSAPLL